MQPQKPILLVEDDNVDAMTVKRAMRDLHVEHSVIHSVNGEEAIEISDQAPIRKNPSLSFSTSICPRWAVLSF